MSTNSQEKTTIVSNQSQKKQKQLIENHLKKSQEVKDKTQSSQDNKEQNKPISSPSKQQRRQKKMKNQAFKSFLERGQRQSVKLQINNKSDHQQSIIEQQNANQCVVCRVQIGKNKKQCGFCKGFVCSQHARKKRKSKQSNKFSRICDNCQDKILFEKYMMLQLKAQQSLIAQQSIIMGKFQSTRQLLETKNAKKVLCQNKTQKLINQHKSFLKQLNQSQNQVNAKLHKLLKRQTQLDALEVELTKIEQKLPRPLDDDFNSLTQQNQKVTKDLVKLQKQCNQAIKVKSKRQKQIYDYYYQWQNKQKNKVTKKQNDSDCIIF